MVDVEVLQKKENPLLKRTEVSFRLLHPKEKTPARASVREKLAAVAGGKREGVVISYLRSRYGVSQTLGYAKIYESAEAAKKMEPFHILLRNGLAEAKKDEAKPAEKPAPPPPRKEEAKAAAPAKKEEAKPAALPAKKEEAKPAAEKPAAEKKK